MYQVMGTWKKSLRNEFEIELKASERRLNDAISKMEELENARTRMEFENISMKLYLKNPMICFVFCIFMVFFFGFITSYIF